jgi:hypothetical protein
VKQHCFGILVGRQRSGTGFGRQLTHPIFVSLVEVQRQNVNRGFV